MITDQSSRRTPEFNPFRRGASTLSRIALVALAVMIAAGALCPVTASAQTPPSAMSSIIVKLVAGLTPTQQADVIGRNGGIEVSQIPALRLHVISVPTTD